MQLLRLLSVLRALIEAGMDDLRWNARPRRGRLRHPAHRRARRSARSAATRGAFSWDRSSIEDDEDDFRRLRTRLASCVMVAFLLGANWAWLAMVIAAASAFWYLTIPRAWSIASVHAVRFWRSASKYRLAAARLSSTSADP